jgi:hypothetical protein
MGVVIHSYSNRRAADRGRGFDDPQTFLDYCRGLGAGGVQTSLGARTEAQAEKLRAFAEKHKLYLEGSIALPRDKDDADRFTAEVRTAKQCGAGVFRTVLMSGRRYEVFDRVGVCLDTGNNLALLEPPGETVKLLAPHALTTHVKDMGVEEYADGFLIAEVPLGTGFLDLAAIVSAVRRANPEIHLNLEMITRDPLKVPCLTPKYWATLENVPGRRLAEMLALVRGKAGKKPLPRSSGLSKEERLRREDDNVKQCLRYAREKLES